MYVGLCLKIGTPQQVNIRRDVVTIKECLDQIPRTHPIVIMESGSRREGFRLEGSDMDYMYWPTNHKVLWDFSQAQFYNTQRNVLILCDSLECPPGFTLLWLPLEKPSITFKSACVKINGAIYISSTKYREITRTLVRSDNESTTHGPCSSGSIGSMEYDDAQCLASDFWPPSASPWIDRCHSWPPPRVANDIIKSGCHFVAIGHKCGNHVDNEWRISFSQAEHKLVCNMNHTQFLIYGLLKLILKEIINNGVHEEEKLLCSYHMKTIIFWAIQQNAISSWCPQNLLAGFWVCFKVLLKWVYEGVCPNFFIPENNMFLNNVFGHAQKKLFTQLYGLYEKGVAFLLESHSIRPHIMGVLCNPRLSVNTDSALISEAMIDEELFVEIYVNDILYSGDLHNCIGYLHKIEDLVRSPLTQYQVVILQKLTATILQRFAFILQNKYKTRSCVNKYKYKMDKMISKILKLAANFGFASDMLYIAMYYYKIFRYGGALSVIEMTKVTFAQPCLMYGKHVDSQKYTEAVEGQSWSYKMRHAVAQDTKLDNEIAFIQELIPEQKSCLEHGQKTLNIPSFILLHMLEFLCCRKLDPLRAQVVLDDLQMLVRHDQGLLVPEVYRGISWEILGICQQMSGNPQAALYSYKQSLRQSSVNKIQSAAIHRINDLHLS